MKTEIPFFHMHEETGQMSAIVKKFLDHTTLMPDELTTLRWYIHQWVRTFPAKPSDYDSIKIMSQDELTIYCTNTLNNWGIDPF